MDGISVAGIEGEVFGRVVVEAWMGKVLVLIEIDQPSGNVTGIAHTQLPIHILEACAPGIKLHYLKEDYPKRHNNPLLPINIYSITNGQQMYKYLHLQRLSISGPVPLFVI